MSESYLGEIRMFAGNFAPQGWALCNGALLSIAENSALFALMGTTYGGDGQTTFALPDLQGRAPMHKSTSYPLGAKGGTETVTLVQNQMPLHTHPANATTSTAEVTNPANTLWATSSYPSYTSNAPDTAMRPVQAMGSSTCSILAAPSSHAWSQMAISIHPGDLRLSKATSARR